MPSGMTKAGDWWEARQRGERLPQHVLPEDTETLIWSQRQETQP